MSSSGALFVRNFDLLLILLTVENSLDFIQGFTPSFGQAKIHKYSTQQAHGTIKEEDSVRTHLAHL